MKTSSTPEDIFIDPNIFETEDLDLGDGWSLSRLRLVDRSYGWSGWFIRHGDHNCTKLVCITCNTKIPERTTGLVNMMNGLDNNPENCL